MRNRNFLEEIVPNEAKALFGIVEQDPMGADPMAGAQPIGGAPMDPMGGAPMGGGMPGAPTGPASAAPKPSPEITANAGSNYGQVKITIGTNGVVLKADKDLMQGSTKEDIAKFLGEVVKDLKTQDDAKAKAEKEDEQGEEEESL